MLILSPSRRFSVLLDSGMVMTVSVLRPQAFATLQVFKPGRPGDAAAAGVHPASDLCVVVAEGRSHFQQPTSYSIVVLPLRGNVRIDNSEGTLHLGPQQLYVGESARSLELSTTSAGAWIGLLASDSAWARLGRIATPSGLPVLPALPALHPATPQRRRVLAELLQRLADVPTPGLRDSDALELGSLIENLQARFLPEIDRCPGRTFARRLNTFSRLQRVRNHIESRPSAGTQLQQLARMANYSPCHLVRAFADAFGETPYALLSRVRLESAVDMLEQHRLAVSDVASVCGFESRTAFSRAFKRHFGISPSGLQAAG
jgi:AraC family transcriptional regulator